MCIFHLKDKLLSLPVCDSLNDDSSAKQSVTTITKFMCNNYLSNGFFLKNVSDFSFVAIKICITSGFEQQCDQLNRESNKEVECIRVRDSVECANILRGETAGFGVFSAESMLLLATLEYDGLTVLKELRHKERQNRK